MISPVRSAWNSAGLGGIKPLGVASAYWLAFLVPLLVFVLAHGAYYFSAAVEESGDYGANALQIENAKRFSEIYGNYSRFHFNHPGPAFFYVYAAAEAVLHDWIPLTRSPATAHSLGGLLLQCAFFAAAVSIYALFFPRRQTVVLAVAAGCIHFCAAGEAFAAIWPPYQLLMPYLCVMVAAAGLMAGASAVLPVLVLAVCFCVHGHVAQAVFVLPSFALAIGLAWRREVVANRDLPPRQAMRQATRKLFWNRGGLYSALIVALFVFPLALDASKGTDSNFALILNYVRHSPAAAKPLSASIVFYLSFLRYWRGLGELPQGTIASNLRDYPLAALAWTVALICPLVWVWTRRRRQATNRSLRGATAPDWKANFVRSGLALVALNGVLAVYWGTRIEEEMFAFNSYFFYSILAMPVLLCVGIAGEYFRSPVAMVIVVIVATTAVLGLKAHREMLPQNSEIPAVDSVNLLRDLARKAGREDPGRASFVYLTFSHSQWDDAAILATHLSRHHIEWRVPAEWGFVFGSNHRLARRDVTGLARALRVSLQAEAPPPATDSRRLPHGDYLILGNPAPVRLDPAGFPRTAALDSEFFRQAVGLTPFDRNSDRTWGEGSVTIFPLELSPADTDVIMTFDLEPMVHPPALSSQEFAVWLGRNLVGHYSLTRREKVPIRISRALWNQSRGPAGTADLAFFWESSAAPLDVGYNDDRRPLAVAFSSVAFAASPAEP